MQIEIIPAISDWISKQQFSSLFLSDWYCQKLGLMYSPGLNGKVTSDKEMICNSHQKYKGANRDYSSKFSVIFKITSKYLIGFVRLILGKVGVDGFTGPRREIDMRYEFGFKVIWKDLGYKQRFLKLNFQATIRFVIVSVRIILSKVGVDGCNGPRRKINIRYQFDLKVILKGLGCK